MDSVSSGWYDDYTRNILERAEELYRNNGDYASHGQPRLRRPERFICGRVSFVR